jgi:hypothetical protein
MAKEAWDAVSGTTIKNCWDHAGIQRAPIMLRIPTNNNNATNSQEIAAWDIIRNFATMDMTLPRAEELLKDVFGDAYLDDKWRPALDAVMAAEEDVDMALDAINKIQLASNVAASPSANTLMTQCKELEEDLMNSVADLKKHNRIFGEVPTLEQLVNPIEEQDVGESLYRFEGDDEIVALVRHEQAVECGEVVEIVSDEEGEEDQCNGDMGSADMIQSCERLKKACLSSVAGSSLEVLRVLCCFRAQLLQVDFQQAKQTMLTSIWHAAGV